MSHAVQKGSGSKWTCHESSSFDIEDTQKTARSLGQRRTMRVIFGRSCWRLMKRTLPPKLWPNMMAHFMPIMYVCIPFISSILVHDLYSTVNSFFQIITWVSMMIKEGDTQDLLFYVGTFTIFPLVSPKKGIALFSTIGLYKTEFVKTLFWGVKYI